MAIIFTVRIEPLETSQLHFPKVLFTLAIFSWVMKANTLPKSFSVSDCWRKANVLSNVLHPDKKIFLRPRFFPLLRLASGFSKSSSWPNSWPNSWPKDLELCPCHLIVEETEAHISLIQVYPASILSFFAKILGDPSCFFTHYST